MSFVIRDAVTADLPAVKDLFRRSSLSNEGDRANLLANPEILEFSDVAVLEGRTRVAVEEDGRIVGFATSLPTEEAAEAAEAAEAGDCEDGAGEAGHVIEVEDLFVDPHWMRQGIGRALMRDMIGTARQGGAGRIEVTANQHALAFYESVGFVFDSLVETMFGSAPRMSLELQ